LRHRRVRASHRPVLDPRGSDPAGRGAEYLARRAAVRMPIGLEYGHRRMLLREPAQQRDDLLARVRLAYEPHLVVVEARGLDGLAPAAEQFPTGRVHPR